VKLSLTFLCTETVGTIRVGSGGGGIDSFLLHPECLYESYNLVIRASYSHINTNWIALFS
jgi:hypothetical protein